LAAAVAAAPVDLVETGSQLTADLAASVELACCWIHWAGPQDLAPQRSALVAKVAEPLHRRLGGKAAAEPPQPIKTAPMVHQTQAAVAAAAGRHLETILAAPALAVPA
jgi:hypothetical protein